MNIHGTCTLFYKEVRRFLAVSLQTVFAPVITAVLYLVVFYPFGEHLAEFSAAPNLEYGVFLIPGLIMMSVLQNAFANSSSSMIQSKFFGNITFLLVSPLSATEITTAFVAAAVVRGIAVGAAVLVCGWFFYDFSLAHPWLMLVFTILCSALLGAMGLIAGIWAEKFDHLAGFQNFVLTPLTFLSGVFYSVHKLPVFWQNISTYNPFLYMIDGLRYTVIGSSDFAFSFSMLIVCISLAITLLLCVLMLRSGYKLRP